MKSLVAVVAFTAAILLASACGGGGGLSEAEQRYNDGLDAQEDGRLEEAVTLYTEGLFRLTFERRSDSIRGLVELATV